MGHLGRAGSADSRPWGPRFFLTKKRRPHRRRPALRLLPFPAPTPLQARVEPYALAYYVYSLPLGNDSHDGKIIVGISTVGAAQPEKRYAVTGPNGNDGA